MESLDCLIFGRGRIARDTYVPLLREAVETGPGSGRRRLETVFVDVAGGDSLRPDRWAHALGPRLAQIDKVLILTPPTVHLANLVSVVSAYDAVSIGLPEIFVEKPLYLRGEREAWTGLLERYTALQTRAFYVDHYRYKRPILWFLRDKAEILSRLGPLRELAWVSLEAQAFWDSEAFAQGYFLEHACHFVTMIGQVFPESRRRTAAGDVVLGGLVPRRPTEWKAWKQEGRPGSCRADSSVLLSLEVGGPGLDGGLPAGVAVTVIVGKGMVDKKFLHLRGERGFCTVWFNEGRIAIGTPSGVETRTVPIVDSYRGVVADILARSAAERRGLLSLREGLEEQETVIAIRDHLPGDEATMGRYQLGEVPVEIQAELARLGG